MKKKIYNKPQQQIIILRVQQALLTISEQTNEAGYHHGEFE